MRSLGFLRDVLRAASAKVSGQSFTEYAKEEKERKQANQHTERLMLTTLSKFLRIIIDGVSDVDKVQQILASSGVMFLLQNAPVDINLLTTR